MEENLICTACNKSWTRERTRGRKPKLCPSCFSLDLDSSSVSLPPLPPDPVLQKHSNNSDIPMSKLYQSLYPKPSNYKEIFDSTKGGSTWQCPSCSHIIKIHVPILSPPTHKCSPDMVSIKLCKRID